MFMTNLLGNWVESSKDPNIEGWVNSVCPFKEGLIAYITQEDGTIAKELVENLIVDLTDVYEE